MAVIFKNDWLKYPDAVIHYETSNKSFLRLAEVYHAMGIENNCFHLSLLDPSLKNVNPHDPNLDIDTKARIVAECKDNLWYYLREVIRIPVPGSLEPIMFEANRCNIAIYWLFLNHVMTLVVILRQTGKTTTLVGLTSYLLNGGATNTFINLLTKNEALKAETLAKVKAVFEELPDYANFSTKKDIFNSDEVKISAFDNKLKGNLSSSSPKLAEKVGRGFTSPINIIDEAAFIENISIAMGAMLMSGNAARTVAAKLGKHYGTILATTAGNTDDRDGRYIYNIAMNATMFTERMYDTNSIPELEELIYRNSNASKLEAKLPIVNITMSYRQLGYDDEWLRTKLKENISTPENIKRDIFNQWLSGSSSSPIPKAYIETMLEHRVEYPKTEVYAPYNYILRWYISEAEMRYRTQLGHHFIIGIDTSDGAGRDDISFVMRDIVNGEIVCIAVFNEINLITLADFFVSILVTYSNTTMIIERKSSAPAMIDYIIQKLVQKGINPFTRLYNTIFQNKELYPKEYEEIYRAKLYNEDIFIKHKRHIGFITSGAGITSRAELYSTVLISMMKYTASMVYDEQLISQISSLIIKNNRVDHPDGGNDDLVIGALLSYWLILNGKNLAHYGIPTDRLMKTNKVYLSEKFAKADDEFDEEELLEKEREFTALIEELRSERNPIIARQIELRLRKLGSEIEGAGQVLSVEEMLEEIRRERKTNY